MDTQMDRAPKNGWGRSHIPPHGREGNLMHMTWRTGLKISRIWKKLTEVDTS